MKEISLALVYEFNLQNGDTVYVGELCKQVLAQAGCIEHHIVVIAIIIVGVLSSHSIVFGIGKVLVYMYI